MLRKPRFKITVNQFDLNFSFHQNLVYVFLTLVGYDVLIRLLRIDYCDARSFCCALLKIGYLFRFKVYKNIIYIIK